ncbi:MAG: hypothetical protein FJ279_23770, partial [Planctomycetes bacterium]|nr:hypothetical protein [Planctomycetota bacterium]
RLPGLALAAFVFASPQVPVAMPPLRFEKVIGDARGKSLDNLAVAVTDDGTTHLLMRSGRVAIFDGAGVYQKSEKVALGWPPDPYYLTAMGKRVFLGHTRQDFPWVFSPQRSGQAPGRFQSPASVALDPRGRICVADAGNRRIQVFAPTNTETPEQVMALSARPVAVAARDGLLAALTDDQALELYEARDTKPTETRFLPETWFLRASLKVGPGVRAVAIGPDGTICVACDNSLKRYQFREGVVKETAAVAPALMNDWPRLFPAGVPLVPGPDGEVWFATNLHGKVLSLNPKTDEVRVRLQGAHRPLAVGFGADGRVYLGGFPRPGAEGPCLEVFSEVSPQGKGEPFPAGGLLYRETGVPVWGLLPDKDGGVYVRIVEPGYRKGWPALTFKKLYRDGATKPFLDFGSLYAVRTTFHPSGAAYALQFDPPHRRGAPSGDKDGNIVLAAIPLMAVLKVTREGQVLWEAGLQPRGGADRIEFAAPRDLAIDRRGNIWVVDSGQHKLFCLSTSGQLLGEFGGCAGVDDVEGKGFDSPTGVEVATADGREFLYVGDAGNQRIVKYRIE